MLDGLHWNPAADSVRLAAGLCFTDISGARNLLADLAGNPCSLAAGGRWALFANSTDTAWLVDTAAAARIPFPCTRILDTLLDHLAGNLIALGHPFAGAFFHCLVSGDWLAGGVADIAVTGFCFRFVSGAANLAIVGLADWLTDGAGHIAVASLEDWLAACVANIAIAGLIDRLLELAGHFAVASLVDRLADGAGHVAVAGLVDRLTHGVALFAVLSLGDCPCASHRHLAGDLIVHGTAALILLGIPDRFLNRLVAGGWACLGCTEVTCGGASCCWATSVAGGTAIFRFGIFCQSEGQQASESDHHGRNSHCSILVPVRTALSFGFGRFRRC